MKKYVTAKELPFIPVGTEFEYDDIGNLYYIDTTNNNMLNYTPREMEQMERDGWVKQVDGMWKPKSGDVVWYIHVDGTVKNFTLPNVWPNPMYELGNIFIDEEQALEASKAVKETLRTFHERRDK